MAMTEAMVRGSRGCVLVKALVFLMAGTTDGAVSLTSLTVPTRPDSYDVLPLVKWPSPMLGSSKRAVKMSTSLVVIKSLVRVGGARALPRVRKGKNAILDRGRVPAGMVLINRVVFLMKEVGWSDKMVVACVLNQRRGLGGRGVRQVSVVALVLIGVSRAERIDVDVVVTKVSVIGRRRTGADLTGRLGYLRRMGATVVELVLISTQGQRTNLSADDGSLVRRGGQGRAISFESLGR